MKKILATVVLTAIVAGTAILSAAATASDVSSQAAKDTGVTINVYNWGEYISDGSDGLMDVNKEFEKRTGIKVNYQMFDTNEALYAKLKGSTESYDIIIPSDYMIDKMISEGMLEKLDFKNIPNYKYIGADYQNLSYDKNNEYSVPYTWGTVGLIYNKDKVKETPDSWSVLWDEQYKGQILMFDNQRDAMALALLKMGEDLNTTDQVVLTKAAEELKTQKPLVQAYVMDQIFNKMSNNEAALAPYYAGDAITMMEDNDRLGYVVPKEGTNRFVDALCIPKGAKHKKEAEAYINFLCDPKVSAANCEAIGYSTPNTEALKLLDPELRSNPIAYPSTAVLEKTQVFTNLPSETNLLYDKLWSEVRSEERR